MGTFFAKAVYFSRVFSRLIFTYTGFDAVCRKIKHPQPPKMTRADPDHKKVVKLEAAHRRLIQAVALDAKT